VLAGLFRLHGQLAVERLTNVVSAARRTALPMITSTS
jgi:hypothetical protein